MLSSIEQRQLGLPVLWSWFLSRTKPGGAPVRWRSSGLVKRSATGSGIITIEYSGYTDEFRTMSCALVLASLRRPDGDPSSCYVVQEIASERRDGDVIRRFSASRRRYES